MLAQAVQCFGGKDVFGGGVIPENGSEASVEDLADSSWLEARNDDV